MLEHNTDRLYFLIGAIVIAAMLLSSVIYINRDILFAPVEFDAVTQEYEGGKVTLLLHSLVGSGPPPIAESEKSSSDGHKVNENTNLDTPENIETSLVDNEVADRVQFEDVIQKITSDIAVTDTKSIVSEAITEPIYNT